MEGYVVLVCETQIRDSRDHGRETIDERGVLCKHLAKTGEFGQSEQTLMSLNLIPSGRRAKPLSLIGVNLH